MVVSVGSDMERFASGDASLTEVIHFSRGKRRVTARQSGELGVPQITNNLSMNFMTVADMVKGRLMESEGI